MSQSKSAAKAKKQSKIDEKLLDKIKHYDSFYEKPPPGLIKEDDEEKPEDVIPDRPENQAAREFLSKAPTKGLWMPLGKEVKVMKCWRCKIYGHRSGDKECPMFMSGNREMEEFRHAQEDPMYNYVKENQHKEKLQKVEMLKTLLYSSEKNKKHKKKHHQTARKKAKNKGQGFRKHRRRERTSSSSTSSSSSSSSSSSTSSSSLSSDSDSSSSTSSSSSSSGHDRPAKRKSKHSERSKTKCKKIKKKH